MCTLATTPLGGCNDIGIIVNNKFDDYRENILELVVKIYENMLV